jgi:hypothetical protein
VINVKCDVNFEVSTAILKNIQVFCDVGLMCHDISKVLLVLKIEALCTVCKYYRLRRRNITQKNRLYRTLCQICAIEINTEKNDLAV